MSVGMWESRCRSRCGRGGGSSGSGRSNRPPGALPSSRPCPIDVSAVVPAGWWSSDTEMDVHDPGTLHASVLPEASQFGQVERCRFVDAGAWMADNISERDTVWLKINVEASEVEVLERLLDTGEIHKVDHLVVHFDVDRLGRASDAVPVRRRLGEAGIEWREAKDVMFGRTDQQKDRDLAGVDRRTSGGVRQAQVGAPDPSAGLARTPARRKRVALIGARGRSASRRAARMSSRSLACRWRRSLPR